MYDVILGINTRSKGPLVDCVHEPCRHYAVTILGVVIMLIVSACSGPEDSEASTGRDFWLHANEEFVRSELDGGTDVNARFVSDLTPLHYAAEGNDEAVVRLLLDWDADLHAKSLGGFVPLHDAARRNDVSVVTLLLDRGANIEATSDNGLTPLPFAAADNELQVVELLLNRGANVDSKSEDFATPLHFAVGNRTDLDVIELLLVAGPWCGPSCNGPDGQTALHIAASASENPEVVESLLDRGADIHAVNDRGETPIHRAARNNENPAVIELLLDYGADKKATDEIGNTACSLSEANLEMREKASSTAVIRRLCR